MLQLTVGMMGKREILLGKAQGTSIFLKAFSQLRGQLSVGKRIKILSIFACFHAANIHI